MQSYSIRLACVGAMIGVLTLSATAVVNLTSLRSRAPTPETGALTEPSEPQSPEGPVLELLPGLSLLPLSMAEAPEADSVDAPEYRVALQIGEGLDRRLFLCDRLGNPLSPVTPDESGAADLGPLRPGCYTVCAGSQVLGAFQLADNAAVPQATGRLWTDGEILHLEKYCPGQAEVLLTLKGPGYYSFRLVDDNGRLWIQDLFIPASALPDQGTDYLRTVCFPGLPEGRYTLVHRNYPLLQFRVSPGTVTRVEAAAEH